MTTWITPKQMRRLRGEKDKSHAARFLMMEDAFARSKQSGDNGSGSPRAYIGLQCMKEDGETLMFN